MEKKNDDIAEMKNIHKKDLMVGTEPKHIHRGRTPTGKKAHNVCILHIKSVQRARERAREREWEREKKGHITITTTSLLLAVTKIVTNSKTTRALNFGLR